jgi:hypothetical protein
MLIYAKMSVCNLIKFYRSTRKDSISYYFQLAIKCPIQKHVSSIWKFLPIAIFLRKINMYKQKISIIVPYILRKKNSYQ